MSFETGTRIGGRGCPECGSHNTEGLSGKGAHWCMDCEHRWLPCTPGCRGYRLDIRAKEPAIIGCPDCQVPDAIARRWPEAWRAMANRLAKYKLEPVK